jgi:hypothetical protein
MAPRKVANPRKSAANYRKNPESYKKKLAYDRKYNGRSSEIADRSEHNKERRRRGVYGKGGGDMSRKKDGSFVSENPSTNRARNRGRK